MAYLYQGSIVPAVDGGGEPYPGAKLYFYLSGTTTLTPTYTDDGALTEHSNPVSADAVGRFPPIFLDPDISYRAKCTNFDGSDTVYDVDPLDPALPVTIMMDNDLSGEGGAALVGIAGGGTVQDALDALGDPLFSSFAGSPPIIPFTQDSFNTSGWDTVGLGAANYIFSGAVDAVHVAANPLTSFLDAGGRGWTINPNQELHIEMFGGKCDTTVSEFTYGSFTATRAISAGTDNLPAIEAAMLTGVGYEYYSAYGHSQPIHFHGYGQGKAYYCSGTIIPPYKVNFKGRSSGHPRGDGTTILFPANTTGVIVYMDGATASGGTSAHRSSFEGIHFLGSGGTTRTAHGIKMRGPVNLRSCTVEAFAGNLLDNQATTSVALSADNFGQTSGSYIERCYLRYAGNWAMFTEGADTSASAFSMIDIQHTRLGGIWDNSHFGNTYIGMALHSFSGGLVGQVSHGGRNYLLIDPTAGIGASTTPGTNNAVWYDTGAGSTYPAWSGSGTYEMSAPIGGSPAGYSSASVFIGTYLEGPIPASPSPGTVMIGGTGGITRYGKKLLAGSGTDALNCPTGFAGYRHYYPDHAELGAWFTAGVGMGDGDAFIHGRATDGSLWKLQHSGADVYYGYGGQGSGNPVISKLTGPNTTETFGSSAAQPHWQGYYGLAIGGRGAMTDAIREYAGNAAPTTGAWRKGDTVRNNSASAGGFAGWICTTAGTPGTWKTFGAISA